MKIFFFYFTAIWPLFTLILAAYFHKKQNSSKAWTGGPISKPKTMWLAYTITTWFFMPLWMLGAKLVPSALLGFYYFHLVSWWIRGPLELVMIYKWLNWSPRYGISHDLFHILGTSTALAWAASETNFKSLNQEQLPAFIFAVVLILTTMAETYFAYLFLSTRSQIEKDENIYFASDDPKWKFINRVTAAVVIPAYVHLFLQSALLFWQ